MAELMRTMWGTWTRVFNFITIDKDTKKEVEGSDPVCESRCHCLLGYNKMSGHLLLYRETIASSIDTASLWRNLSNACCLLLTHVHYPHTQMLWHAVAPKAPKPQMEKAIDRGTSGLRSWVSGGSRYEAKPNLCLGMQNLHELRWCIRCRGEWRDEKI